MGKKNKTPLALRIIHQVFPKVEKFAPFLAQQFFIYIFFTPMRYQATEKEVEASAQADKFTEVINGKKIQCYAWGKNDRPGVLLVHGWAGRATQFRKFIAPLTQAGFRVIGFDGPAHGLSEGRKTDLEGFQRVIQYLSKKHHVQGIITHSFGGGATLYALTRGLPSITVVNIASPTIGEEIIKTYLRAINGSKKTGDFFKGYVKEKTGKTFDSFAAIELIKDVPQNLNLLLIHDLDDKDVSIEQPRALVKRFPRTQLIETQGLGHTRILKDDQVIAQAVTFIERHTSGIEN